MNGLIQFRWSLKIKDFRLWKLLPCRLFTTNDRGSLSDEEISLLNGKTAYEILGVSVNASQKEIRSAYLSRAKETHPDSNQVVGDSVDFRRVAVAFAILGNMESRQAYDLDFLRLRKQFNPHNPDNFTDNQNSPRTSAYDFDGGVDFQRAREIFQGRGRPNPPREYYHGTVGPTRDPGHSSDYDHYQSYILGMKRRNAYKTNYNGEWIEQRPNHQKSNDYIRRNDITYLCLILGFGVVAITWINVYRKFTEPQIRGKRLDEFDK